MHFGVSQNEARYHSEISLVPLLCSDAASGDLPPSLLDRGLALSPRSILWALLF